MIDLTPTALTVTPRKVFAVLLLVSLALGAASVIGEYLRFFHETDSAFGLVENFNVDEEANFPTYFSSLLLLTAASLLAVIARSQRFVGDRMSPRWRILAAVFVVLSVDEAVGIHEMVGERMPEINALGGILYYAWVIPAAIAIAIGGLYFLPFLRDLPNPHRLRFIASACVYVGGALVVELAEGALASLSDDYETWRYQLVATFQELAEMVGASLFIWALLKFIESRGPVLRATVHVSDTR